MTVHQGEENWSSAQSTRINTAAGALKVCRQPIDTLETFKSWAENSAGYDVGKICREKKAVFPTTRSKVKEKADGVEEKVLIGDLLKSPILLQMYTLHLAALGSCLI